METIKEKRAIQKELIDKFCEMDNEEINNTSPFSLDYKLEKGEEKLVWEIQSDKEALQWDEIEIEPDIWKKDIYLGNDMNLT